MTNAPDPVADLVRAADYPSWASAQFAPMEARPHLIALRAFDIELARVRDLVSEPMVGEIRLQWWRDAVEKPAQADHPVLNALEGAISYGRLPREALTGLVDARVDDLYDDPIPTLADLEGRLGGTHSVLIRLASLILARGSDPGGADVAGLGGVAQGIAQLLARLPADAARGRLLIPVEIMAAHGVSRDDALSGKETPGLANAVAELRAVAVRRIEEARTVFPGVQPVAAPAFLPLATVPGALSALAKRTPFAPPPPAPHWLTLIRLWRASGRTPPF